MNVCKQTFSNVSELLVRISELSISVSKLLVSISQLSVSVTYHLSHVSYHLSPVTCHQSPNPCHLPPISYHLSSVTLLFPAEIHRWRVEWYIFQELSCLHNKEIAAFIFSESSSRQCVNLISFYYQSGFFRHRSCLWYSSCTGVVVQFREEECYQIWQWNRSFRGVQTLGVRACTECSVGTRGIGAWHLGFLRIWFSAGPQGLDSHSNKAGNRGFHGTQTSRFGWGSLCVDLASFRSSHTPDSERCQSRWR